MKLFNNLLAERNGKKITDPRKEALTKFWENQLFTIWKVRLVHPEGKKPDCISYVRVSDYQVDNESKIKAGRIALEESFIYGRKSKYQCFVTLVDPEIDLGCVWANSCTNPLDSALA